MNVKNIQVSKTEKEGNRCSADIFRVKDKRYCRCAWNGGIKPIPMSSTPVLCPSCNKFLHPRNKDSRVSTRLMRQVHIHALGGWTDLEVVEEEGEKVVEGHIARIVKSMER